MLSPCFHLRRGDNGMRLPLRRGPAAPPRIAIIIRGGVSPRQRAATYEATGHPRAPRVTAASWA